MWDVFKFQLLSEFAREPEVRSQLLELSQWQMDRIRFLTRSQMAFDTGE